MHHDLDREIINRTRFKGTVATLRIDRRSTRLRVSRTTAIYLLHVITINVISLIIFLRKPVPG